MRFPTFTPALFMLLGLSVPGGVEAQQATAAPLRALPVTVALSPNAEAHSAQIAYIAESALRRSMRHVFIDPVEKFDPDGVHLRLEKRQRAEDAMEYGLRQYENLEEGLGIEAFNRAIDAYEESALWETFPGLTRASVQRILVRWAEDPTTTRREVSRLLAMAPRAEFPPDFTPPELAAEIEREREAIKNAPKFALDVNTQPISARVFVNGVYRGTTPTSVRGLVQGEHFLSLVAPGHQVVQKVVRVGPGATSTETLKPAERARPFLAFIERIRKGYGDVDEVNAARVLARSSEADEVFAVGVRRDAGRLTVEMHRIVASDGHVVAVETLTTAENDPQLASKVDQLAQKTLASDRPRGEKGEPLGVRSGLSLILKDISSVSGEKVRLGVGIGAGVLIVTGVVLGTVANSREADFRQLSQLSAEVDSRSSSGFGMAVAADVITVAGLAAAGTWAWLQFGQKARAKTEIDAPRSPPKEQQKEEKAPAKPKDSGGWDPWAQQSGPSVRPLVGWGSVGMEVGF